jgi:para-aminobenzoate synthetase component 1
LRIDFPTSKLLVFKEALTSWCKRYDFACILDSNAVSSACRHDTFEFIAGLANKSTKTYAELKELQHSHNWKFGYIPYEYNHRKQGILNPHISETGFNSPFFFEPQILLIIRKGEAQIEIIGADESLIDEILKYEPEKTRMPGIELEPVVSQDRYLNIVEDIKGKILEGDFYELNYCMEFVAAETKIDPANVFNNLRKISPTPFGCFLKVEDRFLLCASPERFIKKEGRQIIAQPMKGTVKRGKDADEDEILIKGLVESEKEKAENIMIVDLMRNDLARCCETGSIKAEELLKVYTFSTVHQMISTVSGTLRKDISFEEIIDYVFPMGSMTGAPKREVMHAIDNYESRARGIFSGSVGYISPEHDFDLNVVIRSIVYNAIARYISMHVGSAITYDADPVSEYEECLLKAMTMFRALNPDTDI